MNAALGAAQVAAGLRFAPLLPWWALGLLAALALIALTLAARRRARGVGWRAVALAVVLAWLCGPMLVEERRTPLADIALLAVDQSESMAVGDRPSLARDAVAAIQARAAALPGLELRTVTAPPGGQSGTLLFGAIDRALAELPRDRLAGVIALTDGQVHDAPAALSLPTGTPFHVLLAGHEGETDRRLRLIEAPGYGVVGKSVILRVAVDDLGRPAGGPPARITLRRDGEPPREQMAPIGAATAIELPITHEGPSVVELTAEALPGEVSGLNNRAVVQVTGVRDRLRVLLVSGEPHVGERMWRRLLKADPAVDLIHFTILRPPEKDDLTPLNELALIAFPTRELFQQKVRDFDLIILDRFQNRGILPMPYMRNIADYVRQGGGLLVSVGPEFAGGGSLDETPLRGVLPAHASRDAAGETEDEAGAGQAVAGPFRPSITATGARHPVTAQLPGWRPDTPSSWGRWYRRIAAADVSGQVLMSAPDGSQGGAPLLLLDRVGAGRVALLLSDQIWLWARGHDGGGPQAELMRRIAHWLMKQPDLEENALEAHIEPGIVGPGTGQAGGRLLVTRRSLAAASPVEVTVIDPAGERRALALTDDPNSGTATGATDAAKPGVWQVTDGERSAYAAATAVNPREIEDLRADDAKLAGLVGPSGGGVHWLATPSGEASGPPSLRLVAAGRAANGRDWIGLTARGAHVTSSIATVPLAPDWLALALLLGTVGFAWWRESV